MLSGQTSDIQKRMLDFIVSYIQKEGMPPTNREIGDALKIASTGHVDYHLSVLERKGYIIRESRNSRGIKFTEPTKRGIPIMGKIAAGEPLEVFTEAGQRLDVGLELEQQSAYALVVKGQSMIEDHICDGDYVIIKPQTTCENGDIVVAVRKQDNGRATLKRYFQDKKRESVVLLPANSEMNPFHIPRSEWDQEWEIQGKVIALFRKEDPEGDAISLIIKALLSTSATSPEMEIQAITSEVEKESLKLRALIMQKVAEKANDNLEPAKNDEDFESARSKLREELIESNAYQDEEIIKKAQRVVDLTNQRDIALEQLVSAANNTRDQLDQVFEQSRKQDNRWFQYSLGAAALGFLVFLSGIFLALFTVNFSLVVLTTLASVIPEAAAALIFQQAKEANRRLSEIHLKLLELEGINKAVELTQTISEENQDNYIGLIIMRSLGLKIKEQDISMTDFHVKKQGISKKV